MRLTVPFYYLHNCYYKMELDNKIDNKINDISSDETLVEVSDNNICIFSSEMSLNFKMTDEMITIGTKWNIILEKMKTKSFSKMTENEIITFLADFIKTTKNGISYIKKHSENPDLDCTNLGFDCADIFFSNIIHSISQNKTIDLMKIQEKLLEINKTMA